MQKQLQFVGIHIKYSKDMTLNLWQPK